MPTYSTLHYFESHSNVANEQLREMREEQARRRDEKRRVMAFLAAMSRLYGSSGEQTAA